MPEAPPPAPERPGLVRAIWRWDLTAAIVNGVIGSSIFGMPDDLARKIQKLIRDDFPKVKSQIQGDAVRVSGKSKDELQKVITRLRELDEPVPLQFQNYR